MTLSNVTTPDLCARALKAKPAQDDPRKVTELLRGLVTRLQLLGGTIERLEAELQEAKAAAEKTCRLPAPPASPKPATATKGRK